MQTALLVLGASLVLLAVGWWGWLWSRRLRYRVSEHPGFLSDEECRHLIAAAEPMLRKSKVILSGKSGGDHIDRESATAFLDHGRDRVITDIKRRIAELTNTSIDQQERLQVTHYGQNQRYDPHYDALRAALLEPGAEGDRLHTVILYLNDDFEGGATWFPRIRRRVRAERGKAVFFSNLVADGSRQDRLSLHAGEPVLHGEKWLSNQWIRERPRAKKPLARTAGARRKRSRASG